MLRDDPDDISSDICIYPSKLIENHLSILLKLYPNKGWNYDNLSGNQNITWNFVKSNLDKPWDWFSLSRNPNITWKIVQENPKFLWDYISLSGNPNITFDFVKSNLNKP